MELAVTKREITGKKLKTLRAQWLVPGIIYGKHLKETTMVSVDKNAFIKFYNEEGTSTAVTLKGDKIKELVLVQDIHLDPVTDYILHVDFHAVKADEKVTADIPVILEGISPIAKSGIGRIQVINDTIEVEAFPQDLPKEIVVDISELKALHDTVHVKDLNISKKVEVLMEPEITVLTVVEFVEEEEEDEEELTTAEEGEEAGEATGEKKVESKDKESKE